MTSTIADILQLIETSYGIDASTIDPAKPLSDFGLDSLTLAELVFAIEDRFEIEYPDANTNVQTLNELARVVDEVRAVAVTT